MSNASLRMAAAALTAIAFLFAAPIAHAGEVKAGAEHLDLTGVPLPIIVNGRLMNYVFVVLRLTPQPGADLGKIRAREAYLRDYLLRLGHKQPFVQPGDMTRVDERRLLNAAAAEMPHLIGPKLVRTVAIASQTPQRRSGLSTLTPIRSIVP